jgi:hypothetical protein
MKFLIIRSCIFFRTFPSNLSPLTMIARAAMFIHVLTFYVGYKYLKFILILNSKLKQNETALNILSLWNINICLLCEDVRGCCYGDCSGFSLFSYT